MVQHEGIEVHIVRVEDDHRYEEHERPSLHPGSKANRIFIEAVTGERFAIVVECLPSFDWKRTSDLRIQFWIDNRDFYMAEFLTKREVNHRNFLMRRRQVRQENETWLVDGKWTSCGLAFADVKVGKLPETNLGPMY